MMSNSTVSSESNVTGCVIYCKLKQDNNYYCDFITSYSHRYIGVARQKEAYMGAR